MKFDLDEYESIFREMEEEDLEWEARYRVSETALGEFQRVMEEDNRNVDPQNVWPKLLGIREVLGTQSSTGIGGMTRTIDAALETEEGEVFARLLCYSDSGSREEPPDEGEELEFDILSASVVQETGELVCVAEPNRYRRDVELYLFRDKWWSISAGSNYAQLLANVKHWEGWNGVQHEKRALLEMRSDA
jgi:hypothetical protein